MYIYKQFIQSNILGITYFHINKYGYVTYAFTRKLQKGYAI